MHNMNINSFSTPTLLHAVRAVMMMDLDIFADILQPCGSTPWASAANPAKFLPAQHRTGVLSTTGAAKAAAGFPLGSVVEYGVDSQGRPVFALSSLSGHTRDIRSDPRCSLTVTSPGFQVAMMTKHMYPKQDPRYQMYTRACAKQTARLTALAPWEGVIHWAESAACRKCLMTFWWCAPPHEHAVDGAGHVRCALHAGRQGVAGVGTGGGRGTGGLHEQKPGLVLGELEL